MNANAFAMTTLMLFSTNVNISLNLSSTSGSFLYVYNNMRRSFKCQNQLLGPIDRTITKRSDIFVILDLMNANAFALTTLMLFPTNVNISLNLSSTSGSFLYVNNNMRRSFECQKSAVLTDRKFRKSMKYYNIYV